jgi:hypothetical protein
MFCCIDISIKGQHAVVFCTGLFTRRYDIQHRGIQYNDTHLYDIQLNENLHYDIQHSDTHHYDVQHNDTRHNDIHHNDTHHNETQHYVI